ncbi:MAG: virulence RhuM family protein [Leptospiraceae bacterium]|nr:virulence RhuM family protein [Leptospiraceae bacterium]
MSKELQFLINSKPKDEVKVKGVVQDEGGREVMLHLEFYNLDAIISVGYRVNSAKVTKNLFYPQMNANKRRFNFVTICENPILSADSIFENYL